MNVLVTGSNGFIAKNLITSFEEDKKIKIKTYNKKTKENLESLIKKTDVIYHLAGQNKSQNNQDFLQNNNNLTKIICEIISKNNLNTKIIFYSNIQIKNKYIYGITKLEYEKIIKRTLKKNQYTIIRIPNVFGKWSRPNYNSVVATFAYLISRKKKIKLINKNKKLKVVYIDDLILCLKNILYKKNFKSIIKIKETYITTPFKIYKLFQEFYENDLIGRLSDLSNDFKKKMYSTYLSYIPYKKMTNNLKTNLDERGYFAEFLKSTKFGQVSAFSILPGKKRGGHYHHTKTEKFMLINGTVQFKLINLINGNELLIKMSKNKNKIVSTVPGWAHEICNNTDREAHLVVWANEIFNKKRPDTFKFDF